MGRLPTQLARLCDVPSASSIVLALVQSGMWCMMVGSLQMVCECDGKRLRCPHQHLLVLISVSAATAFMLRLEYTMDISSVVLMFLWPGRLVCSQPQETIKKPF